MNLSNEAVEARNNLKIGMVLYNPCYGDPKCQACQRFRELCRQFYHQRAHWPAWVVEQVEAFKLEKSRSSFSSEDK